jgi:hypothetical protein
MAEIVSLAEHRPHLSGSAECCGCRHQWQAVAPIGVEKLECPACHLDKGFWAKPVLRAGDAWTCNCGSQLFRIAPHCGPYCVNCGAAAEGWFK